MKQILYYTVSQTMVNRAVPTITPPRLKGPYQGFQIKLSVNSKERREKGL